MRFKKLFITATLALVAVCSLSAQDTQLERGRRSFIYQFSYNGTYLWENPTVEIGDIIIDGKLHRHHAYVQMAPFEKGEVLYNGKLYDGVLVNVDASEEMLMVKSDEKSPIMTPDRNSVACFTKGDKCFINLKRKGISDKFSFFEVLTDGKVLYYRHVQRALLSETGVHDGEKILGYEDPNYDEEVLSYYRFFETFYIEKDGALAKAKVSRHKKEGLRNIERDQLFSLVADDNPFNELYDIREKISVIKDSTRFINLPLSFFDEEGKISDKDAELLKSIEEDNEIATYQNKVYEIGKNASGKSKATVTGCVRDVSSKEPIPGVTIYDDNTKTYVYTDGNGNYKITLPSGENVLNFSEYTKDDMRIRVIVRDDGTLDIVMKEKVISLDAAIIMGETMERHRTANIGVEKISAKTLTKIPSAFGEGDILKAVQTLPGVQTVGEASNGINVRGGATDQNLILLGESTIYNPTHMFGLFSAFNPDVVSGVELYKSSVPAQYGGRISAVMDVAERDGNKDKIKANMGLGVLTSRFEIDGPLTKSKKTTFILGARTTYSDYLLKMIPKSSGYSGGAASFSDINLGVSHKFNDRNTLRAFGYWSTDKFRFSADTSFRYSNLNAHLTWDSDLSDDTKFTLAGGYDQYTNSLDNYVDEFNAYTLDTKIGQAFIKAGFKTQKGDHTFSYGVQALSMMLRPGMLSPFGESSTVVSRNLVQENAILPDIYIGDEFLMGDAFQVNAGLRYSSYYGGKEKHYYGAPEVRLSAKYSILPNLSLKAGFNSMTQYIHQISNTSTVSPMDTWKLSDASVKPQYGWQAAAGAYFTVNSRLDLSFETYYKNTTNYLDYKSGAVLVMNENLADALVPTYNKAYGMEFMVKKPVGKLNGWISYTYSRSLLKEMNDRGSETINGGDWYSAPYDKPHDFKLVANYDLTHRYSFTVNMNYSTGRPVTIPVGKYSYNGGYRLTYSERNAYRIPDYFRLDLAFNVEPGHYLKKFTHMSFTFGCYNVTGRKNAYSVYFTTAGGGAVQGYMVSVFACQIPYVNLNLKF